MVFTDDFLDALDDWLLDTTLDKVGKAQRLAGLSIGLPERFRSYTGLVYRRVDLAKAFVAAMGAYLVIDESTSSWTKDLDLAKQFYPLPREPKLGFIFQRQLLPGEAVLDIHALEADPDFQERLLIYGRGRGGFDYMAAESEVLARVKRVSLNDVAAAGTNTIAHGPRWLDRSAAQEALRRWLMQVDTVLAQGASPDGEVVGGWQLGSRTIVDLRPSVGRYPVLTELDNGRLVCRDGLRAELLDGSPTEVSLETCEQLLQAAGVTLTEG